MGFDRVWESILDGIESLDPQVVLVTPTSSRAFDIESTTDDRLDIRYRDTGEERTLWHDQFRVLDDRLTGESAGIPLSELPIGVEPYVSVMSLAEEFAVDAEADSLRRAEAIPEEQEDSENPFVRPEWTARNVRERVHDDAVLLVDQLRRHPFDDLGSGPVEHLVDTYVLLSDVQRGANRFRRRVGEELLDRIGPDDRLHGQFGTVRRTHRERRRLKEPETIFEALDDRGIPRDWVLGVDRDKLDVVLTVTDLEKDEVYDIEDQVYVQKTGVEEAEKQSRLQGLAERLDALESDEAEEIHREIKQLETRLDDLLAAG